MILINIKYSPWNIENIKTYNKKQVGAATFLTLSLTTGSKHLGTEDSSVFHFKWVFAPRMRQHCVIFTYSCFFGWQSCNTYLSMVSVLTASDFVMFRSPCTDFHDSIMSVFYAVLPEGPEITGTDFCFSHQIFTSTHHNVPHVGHITLQSVWLRTFPLMVESFFILKCIKKKEQNEAKNKQMNINRTEQMHQCCLSTACLLKVELNLRKARLAHSTALRVQLIFYRSAWNK